MLTPLDLIILAVIGLGMYQGARKGIFKRATTIFSIILGVMLGFRTRHIAETLYLDYFRMNVDPQLMVLLSFGTAFIVIYILSSTVFGYLTSLFGKVNLKLDNALGALFGGFLSVLALSVAFTVLAYGGFPSGASRNESVLYPYVREFARQTLGVGATVLKDASKEINKYGLEKPGQGGSTSPATNPPANRPKPIRP